MSNDGEALQSVKDYNTLINTLNNPAFRIPVDMNINKFKKMLDNSDLVITKAERNRLIRQYKQKAWSEYDDIVKSAGSFPTRNNVVKKSTNGEDDGKQSEQTADLSLA